MLEFLKNNNNKVILDKSRFSQEEKKAYNLIEMNLQNIVIPLGKRQGSRIDLEKFNMFYSTHIDYSFKVSQNVFLLMNKKNGKCRILEYPVDPLGSNHSLRVLVIECSDEKQSVLMLSSIKEKIEQIIRIKLDQKIIIDRDNSLAKEVEYKKNQLSKVKEILEKL